MGHNNKFQSKLSTIEAPTIAKETKPFINGITKDCNIKTNFKSQFSTKQALITHQRNQDIVIP